MKRPEAKEEEEGEGWRKVTRRKVRRVESCGHERVRRQWLLGANGKEVDLCNVDGEEEKGGISTI